MPSYFNTKSSVTAYPHSSSYIGRYAAHTYTFALDQEKTQRKEAILLQKRPLLNSKK